jgi:GNAT superfamily N-acetyltransferase
MTIIKRMRSLIIVRQNLNQQQVAKLINDTWFFPDLVYISSKRWLNYHKPYVIYLNQQFAGACAICEFRDWIKVGPLVLLKKYQGLGIARQLLTQISSEYSQQTIFVSTTNERLQNLLVKFQYKDLGSFWTVPVPMGWFLIYQFFQYLSWPMIGEYFRKTKYYCRCPRKYFVKKPEISVG